MQEAHTAKEATVRFTVNPTAAFEFLAFLGEAVGVVRAEMAYGVLSEAVGFDNDGVWEDIEELVSRLLYKAYGPAILHDEDAYDETHGSWDAIVLEGSTFGPAEG